MAKMFDELMIDNKEESISDNDFNLFLSRLLFCFFAEDTGLFEKDLFSKILWENTKEDGSDLNDFFTELFEVLNIESRSEFRSCFSKFPYVNGGLFQERIKLPNFSKKTRKIIYESASTLEWSEINPDIFGSMMQAVVRKDKRSKLGMHYTSVENIHKVIDPLFLNDLRDAIDMAKSASNPGKSLRKLLSRIREMKIFDPACGSGNFLIITYKELRKLEDEIHETLGQIPNSSGISLSNFYGVEVDPFAVQTAKLSLWIAYHQMNSISNDLLNSSIKSLPLKDSGNIVCANACRVDWEDVCPKKNDDEEIYIIGNPPYLGSKLQNNEQKLDLEKIFLSLKLEPQSGLKTLDYISAWFIKTALYISSNTNIWAALVSTNSISQGEQAGILMPLLNNLRTQIFFAHTSFLWKNNAKKNAGVTCVIIGLTSKEKTVLKRLYNENSVKEVKNINGYLLPALDIVIIRRKETLSSLPKMSFGNMPNDGGHLILDNQEKDSLISENIKLKKYIKKLVGADEIINGYNRWCLWFKEQEPDIFNSIEVNKIIEAVKKHRLSSSDKGTNKLAARPYQFRDLNETISISIVVPSVSSERREYIPIAILDKSFIVLNSAQVIYDPPVYIFGIISSHMHMVWVRAVAGRLESRIR
jgi:type II restriction/modification system DNA methylase subunit YeeA